MPVPSLFELIVEHDCELVFPSGAKIRKGPHHTETGREELLWIYQADIPGVMKLYASVDQAGLECLLALLVR